MTDEVYQRAADRLRQILESIEEHEAARAAAALAIDAIYVLADSEGFETETLREIVRLRAVAAQEAADAAARGPRYNLADDLGLCESPIEEGLLRALYAATWPDTYQPQIHPQMESGPYRVDFMVTDAGGRHSCPIVVECDGHNFHERTKEQAARDRARDRFFTLAGFKVMRFTGSEIHRNAAKCAAEVVAVALTTVPE